MQLVSVAVVVVVGFVVIGIGFLLAMRAKLALVHRPLIWLQRRVRNPQQMRSAGTPGAYAAVIRHQGRVSGRAFETPVGAVPTDDGFLIALPYGLRSNWLRNVLASGSAAIVHEGNTFAVDRPELVPMETVANRFSAGDQRSFRFLRVDQCLRVRSAAPDGAAG
jgi:hypothetical protein